MAVLNPEPSRVSVLPEQRGFFSISADNVVLSTMKKSEDDNGVIFRLYEDIGASVSARMRFPVKVAAAQRTNMIEEDGVPISFRNDEIPITMNHHSIETFKVFPQWK
jgi:alpha-mannosidase